MASRRWFYLIPARASRAVWCTRSSGTTSIALPGNKTPYAGRTSSKRVSSSCLRAARGWPWSIRPTARFRTCRASTPARSNWCGARRRRGVVRRSRAAVRGALGRGGDRRHTAGVRQAVSHQGSRVRGGRPGGSRDGIATTEFDIQQLMWQWFDEEGADQRCGTHWSRRRRTRAIRTTCRAQTTAGRSAATSCCCWILWGKLEDAWRGVCGHHAGSGSPARQVPEEMTRVFDAARDARDAAVAAGRRRPPARARRARLRTGSRGAGGDRAAGYGALHPASHRPQPRARRCTATARTWTTTRRTTSAGCCPAPASRSSRASISIASACERKSTWCGAPSGPEVTGPRQQEIVATGV